MNNKKTRGAWFTLPWCFPSWDCWGVWSGKSSTPQIAQRSEKDFQTFIVCTRSKCWDSKLKLVFFFLLVSLLWRTPVYRTADAKNTTWMNSKANPLKITSEWQMHIYTTDGPTVLKTKGKYQGIITLSCPNSESTSSQTTNCKTH